MAKILIADDESKIRRLLKDFAKRSGHTTVEAATGRDFRIPSAIEGEADEETWSTS